MIGARELFSKSLAPIDAYVVTKMGGHTMYKSKTVSRSSSPVYGEQYIFDIASGTAAGSTGLDLSEVLRFEIYDQELFGSDVLLGTATTTIEQVFKGQESTSGKGLETFFHLIPPLLSSLPSSEKDQASVKQEQESSFLTLSSDWVQTVIEKSVKAGEEAVGGVASTWARFFTSESAKNLNDSIQPQGRLYVRFRIAPAHVFAVAKSLPTVVPPAKLPPAEIRARLQQTNQAWNDGDSGPDRNFRVLSLDGGGVRGILTAGILRRLVSQGRFPQLLEDADLIAGTSTGGILALLFAAGYSPAEAQRMYLHHCPKIFTTSPARKYSPFNAKYESTYLRNMMNAYFQDLRMDELPKPVVTTAFKIRNDDAALNDESGKESASFYEHHGLGWQPCLFSNIPRYSGTVEPDSALCADVACRTSAAPTYFPAAEGIYVDGAIFANNPALTAMAKAKSHYRHVRTSRVAMLSIGSGSYDYFIPKEEGTMDWGLRQWAPYLRNILLDSSAISLDTNMSLLMGEQYHRVNPPLRSDMDLDDVEGMDELVRVSEEVNLDTTEKWIRTVWY